MSFLPTVSETEESCNYSAGFKCIHSNGKIVQQKKIHNEMELWSPTKLIFTFLNDLVSCSSK